MQAKRLSRYLTVFIAIFFSCASAYSMSNPLPMVEVILFPLAIQEHGPLGQGQSIQEASASPVHVLLQEDQDSSGGSRSAKAFGFGSSQIRQYIFNKAQPASHARKRASIRLLGKMLKSSNPKHYANRMGSVTGNN